MWIAVSIAPGAIQKYAVSCHTTLASSGRTRRSRVHLDSTSGASVEKQGSNYVLANPNVRVLVPAVATDSVAPSPFQGMSVNGKLVGGSHWNTSLVLLSFTATITAPGPVYAEVVLAYTFENGGNVTIGFRLSAEDTFVTVDDQFHAGSSTTNDAWVLDLSASLGATKALIGSTHSCDMSDPYSQPTVTGDYSSVACGICQTMGNILIVHLLYAPTSAQC